MCHIRENSVHDRLYANWKSNADSARVLIAGTYYQGLALDLTWYHNMVPSLYEAQASENARANLQTTH